MTQNCFLNGLCHHLRDTKTSETSGTSKFVEYIHSIPESHKHSSGIVTVIIELNGITIHVIESHIWQICQGIKRPKMHLPSGRGS